MISVGLRPWRPAVVMIATLVFTLAWAAGARAGLAGGVLGGCPGQPLSQPFLPWLDASSYVFAGDGGFESGARGWNLKGGAAVVSGNEPWRVHSAADSHSLSLPAGARAASPATCIGLLHPTTRFFARSLGGTLKVDATVTIAGVSIPVLIGVVVAGNSFAPTLPLPLLANLTAPLSGSGSVTLTFTAVGGAVQIDDLYIDPFKVN
jgi:hypothetical protein